jgi:GT2 family glycosyltransferase
MRKNDPLVSVVILNYNGLKYLKRTIPGILKLSYNNLEILIVDNGSTDGSLNFIRKFRRIILIKNKENLGYSKGKNIGVQKAKGKYVFLLDEDILISDKKYLDNLIKFYIKNKKVCFLSPLLIDENSIKTKYYGLFYGYTGKKINKKINIPLRSDNLIKIGSFSGGAVFFKKLYWSVLGGYDEDYKFGMNDYDIGARSNIMGYSNYLYLDKLIHIGKNKDLNKKYFAKKMSFYYEGIFTMILKNYNKKNLIISCIIYIPFILFLNSILIIFKFNIYLILSPFLSIFNISKKFSNILKKRKIIQSKRVVKNDIFLKIKPPKFE